MRKNNEYPSAYPRTLYQLVPGMERRAPQKQLRNLILIFTDKILDHRTYHLNLFFNEDWESKYRIISYGHDIEASWLLHEAAIELGNNEILQKVEPLV